MENEQSINNNNEWIKYSKKNGCTNYSKIAVMKWQMTEK